MKNYDVIVVGAGPGGYVAAIRCAQLGLATACVESWRQPGGTPALGGTCLNVGCIPSKALLESSHLFTQFKSDASGHGIHAQGVSINVGKMMERKKGIVRSLNRGIGGLLRKNGVEVIYGHATIAPERASEGYCVEVKPDADGDDSEITLIIGQRLIIATGSKPAQLPIAKVDNKQIVDSTGALEFEEAPRRLGIIGAGAIGLEIGSVWKRLGAEVTILEAMDSFLAPADPEIAQQAYSILSGKQGLDIRLDAQVTGVGLNKQEVIVSYQDGDNRQQLNFDRLIVAIGRSPNTEGLGAEACGLELDTRGFIKVDEHGCTNLPGIYAIGDVVGGAMLAHKASEEGVAVAERIAGRHAYMNYQTVPWIIYTWPEIAWLGMTERTLRERGIDYRSGTFPFIANSRANITGTAEGMVKILADGRTDKVLGVHMFGPHVSELIAEAVLAMEFDATSEDIARTIHSHPSLSEAVHEAALSIGDGAIHI